MKKVFVLILFFMYTSYISAEEITVQFSKCIDGDTAKFIYIDEEITVRFLTIDTPETVHPQKDIQEYGKEASDYTCNKIKKANKIVLEFDEKSPKNDKYGRYLVWVFLDDNLIQKELIEKGLAVVHKDYDDYKYADELKKIENIAKKNKIGIWNDSSEEKNEQNSNNKNELNDKEINNSKSNKIISFVEKYKDYIVLIGALIIIYIFNLKPNKKIKNKLKRKLKNDIKKRLK